MREIKFRAWYKVHGSWCSDSWLKGNWNCAIQNENIILMQYTGLKDKNGKEIYDGDIVIVERHGIFNKSKIVFLSGSFMCEWLDDYCYSEELSRILLKQYSCLDNKWCFEVIGNIYENAELISGGDNAK